MICIVSSCGGHLTEIRSLLKILQKYSHFYVINDIIDLPMDMKNNTFFIKHSERDLKFFINLIEALVILQKTKPKIIISAGAGPAVPVTLIGKILYKTEIIFIESITRVNKPSLTGRILYFYADHFFYQWKELKNYYKKGTYVGTII